VSQRGTEKKAYQTLRDEPPRDFQGTNLSCERVSMAGVLSKGERKTDQIKNDLQKGAHGSGQVPGARHDQIGVGRRVS
jgi:hypothetical protein